MSDTKGKWVPMRHDDPYNDGPVWLDENGRLCWTGANGETQCLVLHGDMAVCLFVPDDEGAISVCDRCGAVRPKQRDDGHVLCDQCVRDREDCP